MVMIRADKRRGDPISAAEHNRIAAVSKSVESILGGRGITSLVSPIGTALSLSQVAVFRMPAIPAWARNAGQNILEPYRTVGVIDQVFKENNPDQDRMTRVVLQVKDPSEAEGDGSHVFYGHDIAVAAERIEPGQVGLVFTRGLCPAYLRIPDEDDVPEYAALEWRQNQLSAAEGGMATIIWSSGVSDELAIVELGKPSPDVPIPIRNTTALVAPFGGIAEVVGADDDDTLRIVRPTGDDEENVLLVANFDILANGYGFGWESEAHTVLWNGAAPSVGDRLGSQTGSWYGAESSDGTFLIRAVRGGTALAFFTKAAAPAPSPAIQHLNFSYIRDDVPAANFGFPNNMIVRWSGLAPPGDFDAKGFTEIDPAVKPISGNFHYLSLNMIDPTNLWPAFNIWTTLVSGGFSVTFRAWEITANFDASLVTWNNHGLLPVNLIAEWTSGFTVFSYTNSAPDWAFVFAAKPAGTGGFTLTNCYGFMFDVVVAGGTPSAAANAYLQAWSFGAGDQWNKVIAV